IHSYAFNRYLKTMGTALGLDTTAWQSADVPPTPEEVETHFQQDLLDVDLAGAKDVSAEIYSRDLVPVGSDATPSIFTTSFRSGAFLIPATAGEEVRMSFVEAGVVPTVFYVSTDDFQGGMTSFVRTPIDGVVPDGTAIRFTASATGYYPIVWNNRTLAEVSHRGVLVGDSSTQLNAATLYFYVPSGTSSFLIRTSAYGGPSVTVQDGSGNVILSVDGRARTGVVSPISSGEYIIDVPAGADGAVWSFTGPYDSNRTASVTLVGVPNYLSFQPAMLLVPREALR
ncbi:MAG: hypothetical protein HYY16_17475, partial [Planctomycetes bacterium]|nr:hypothetical protein [Planctomycetota bacterium]